MFTERPSLPVDEQCLREFKRAFDKAEPDLLDKLRKLLAYYADGRDARIELGRRNGRRFVRMLEETREGSA